MVSSRAMSEWLAKWVFGLMFTGMNVAFMPMHLAGLMGMPRRVYTYLPGSGWDMLNLISTVGAFLFAFGVLLFLIDLARNFRMAPGGGNAGNVYGAGSLEWLPTELYSTRSIPVVKSREPLWDDPKISDNVEQGRYFLPRSATGLRETIVTSPLLAEPQYVQIMPGPSVWPLVAAIFTAFFFLALTVQAYMFGLASGVITVMAMLRWLSETDRPIAQDEVDIGAGIMVPTYMTGPRSHGWWAMVILMIVMAMISAMAMFGLAFLWSNQPTFWTPPALLGEGAPIALGYGLVVAAAVSSRWLHRIGNNWAVAPVLLAGLAAPLLTWLDIRMWSAVLAPDASGQGAAVFAILSLQGTVAAIGILFAAYLGWRALRGLITPTRNSTLDLACLFIGYCGAQGLVGTIFTRAVGA